MSYIQVPDGTHLYTEMVGDGETILFAHEFGGDWRSWREQVRHFSKSYRCVRYCARGFYPSDVPACKSSYGQSFSTNDLLAVADALELQRFHLVGLSMGSFTSLMFALAHPKRLISLTLAGCSSGPTGEAQRTQYREDLNTQITLLDKERGDGAVRWFSEDAAYPRMPEKQKLVWEGYRDNLRAQSVDGARNILSTVHWNRLSIFEQEAALRRITVPTLLVYGDEDYHLVEPTNEFLKATLPASSLMKLERTGHLVNLEEPDIFNRTLDKHLKSASSANDG